MDIVRFPFPAITIMSVLEISFASSSAALVAGQRRQANVTHSTIFNKLQEGRGTGGRGAGGREGPC